MDATVLHLGRLLEQPSETILESAINASPLYMQLARAGQCVVRCIHAVPGLYERPVDRGQLDFYLGRTGATPRNVLSRFRAHAHERGMSAGAVVFRCSTEAVGLWETAAVRVLKGLEARNRLCVHNVAADSRGAIPTSEESAIYLVWRVRPDIEPLNMPTRRDVEDIASEVSATMQDVATATIRSALDPVTRPVWERAELDWASGHERARRET